MLLSCWFFVGHCFATYLRFFCLHYLFLLRVSALAFLGYPTLTKIQVLEIYTLPNCGKHSHILLGETFAREIFVRTTNSINFQVSSGLIFANENFQKFRENIYSQVTFLHDKFSRISWCQKFFKIIIDAMTLGRL